MPFAGHPNVGTGWVLARQGRDRDGVLRFEEIAGLVEIRVERDGAAASPAPSPSPRRSRCRSAPEMPVELLAGCVGLDASDVVDDGASAGQRLGRQFLRDRRGHRRGPDARRAATSAASARPAEAYTAMGPNRLPLYLYAHDGAQRIRLRARMFSPLSGTIEDPATGSAATPLAALLLSLGKDCRTALRHRAGRRDGPAQPAACSARRAADGIRANVGGGCVPVLKGEISL